MDIVNNTTVFTRAITDQFGRAQPIGVPVCCPKVVMVDEAVYNIISLVGYDLLRIKNLAKRLHADESVILPTELSELIREFVDKHEALAEEKVCASK